MNKISGNERKNILELFYKGNSRQQIGAEVHHSTATVQRVIKGHEQKVKENGLISELSEERLTEPLELARCYGEMKTANVSVTDCRDAVPVVQKCRELKIEDGAVNELIDAAIAIGSPEFPRPQFTADLLRILRLEKTSGQTISQLASTNEELNREVSRRQSQRADLTAQIEQLNSRRVRMEQDIRSDEQRLAALRTQLERIPITEAQLSTYIRDRDFLASLGFTLADTASVRTVLVEVRDWGFSTVDVLGAILQIKNLRGTLQTLTTDTAELRGSLETLTKSKAELEKEIEKLNSKLPELRKEVQKEEQENQTKIMNLKQQFNKKLSENDVSERDLAEYVVFRDTAGKEGLKV